MQSCVKSHSHTMLYFYLILWNNKHLRYCLIISVHFGLYCSLIFKFSMLLIQDIFIFSVQLSDVRWDLFFLHFICRRLMHNINKRIPFPPHYQTNTSDIQGGRHQGFNFFLFGSKMTWAGMRQLSKTVTRCQFWLCTSDCVLVSNLWAEQQNPKSEAPR